MRIWPFRHFGLKLLSVALAVLLWMVVSGEETVERGLRVPLELQQFPPGLELLADAPTTADVRVKGASGTLSRVSPGDIVAVLDLRSARPGQRLFHLTPEQVRVPLGVEVVQVSPATVAMVFENTATRTVTVAPASDGKPAAGFAIGTVSADPPTVEIVGPESAVKRATQALTEPVSVAGAEQDVREQATIGMLDPSLRLKTVRAATVTVTIVPAPLERTLHNRPVRLRNIGAHLTSVAMPAAVDVSIRGSREALSRVGPDDVVPYVDLAGLGAGTYMLSVRTDAAKDAGITGIEPSLIQVRISSVKN